MKATQDDLFAVEPTPPYVRRSRTSKAAALSMVAGARPHRERVRDFLAMCGTRGATDEEMQSVLGINPNTQRPRRCELEAAGVIRDSGRTRTTASGRQAVVWVLSELVAAERGGATEGATPEPGEERDR